MFNVVTIGDNTVLHKQNFIRVELQRSHKKKNGINM